MKFFYAIFLLLFLSVGDSFSQDSSSFVFRLNNLTPDGVVLNKHWKFQVGDNPEIKVESKEGRGSSFIILLLFTHNI